LKVYLVSFVVVLRTKINCFFAMAAIKLAIHTVSASALFLRVHGFAAIVCRPKRDNEALIRRIIDKALEGGVRIGFWRATTKK
jgi:hypothetical protein